LAPANTDPVIVNKLYQATLHAFRDPDLKARFDATGTVLVGTSPEEFAGIIKTDIDKWALVIKAADMRNQN
jgi:tripartite-type tricarboxylate transporter receptor subunit TctC